MNLYKIKDWNSRYENAQSRKCEQLHWVPIPARHDAERYCELMAKKDAAEIYSAWIICLQVGARSHPRGSLVRSDGSPHNPESLSIKTRADQKWFEKALPYLTQIGWLECVMNDDTIQLPSNYQSNGSQVGKKEGTEQKEHHCLVDDGFLRFWDTYPKRVGKGAVKKIWQKISPNLEMVEKIIKAVEDQSKSSQWLKEGGKFIPMPATWLNQERWEDEVFSGIKREPSSGPRGIEMSKYSSWK